MNAKLACSAILAFLSFALVLQPPAAAQAPPYYYQTGGCPGGSTVVSCNGANTTATFSGLSGQGTCLVAITGTASVTGTENIPGSSSPITIKFYDGNGGVVGSSFSASASPVYFKCANVTSVTLSLTVAVFGYTLIATTQAWPFLASDLGPSPSPGPSVSCNPSSATTYACVTPGPPSAGVGSLIQNGFASLTGIALNVGSPAPSPSPTFNPQAVLIGTDNGQCSTGVTGWVQLGTSASPIPAAAPYTPIRGDNLSVGCESGVHPNANLDVAGDLQINGYLLTGQTGLGTPSLKLATITGIEFPSSSSSDAPCLLQDSNDNNGVLLKHTGAGTCSFELPDLLASSSVCTSASSVLTTTGCPTPAPAATPSPTVTATACAGAPAISGAFPYTLKIPAGCSGAGSGNVALQAAAATPSPQVGDAALNGRLTVGPTPSPYASFEPQALLIATNSGCSPAQAQWGTTSANEAGVVGNVFAAGCPAGFPTFTSNSTGDIGVNRVFTASTIQIGGGQNLTYPTAATGANPCNVGPAGSGFIKIQGSGGTCQLVLSDTTASGALCILANFAVAQCSTLATSYGEVTCSVTAATSCTATATVRSGARCQATYESTDTTVALAVLLPASVHTVTTTATFTLQAVSASTGTLAANYWCP